MDLRIDGTYSDLLVRLASRFGEPTATGMVRALIRDAASKAGLWPLDSEPVEVSVTVSTEAYIEREGL